MKTSELLQLLKIEDIMDLPKSIMEILFGDKNSRNNTYRDLLRLWNYDLSKDWFQDIYEEEVAQRKQSKQDFTPVCLSSLVARLTGLPNGIISDYTAGNGGMIICGWNEKRLKGDGFKPSDYVVSCWDISSRSIPILLLNLSIRGIMGEVVQGDVLTMNAKIRYVLLNEQNDSLAFSDVVISNIDFNQIYSSPKSQMALKF